MSALDQAIMKAYAKDRPAGNVPHRAVSPPRLAPSLPQPAGSEIERVYRDGTLYRLDRAQPSSASATPNLTQLPPTSPKRNVRRSLLKLMAASEEAAAQAPPPERPRVARKVIIRHISHSAAPPPKGLLRPVLPIANESRMPLAELPPESAFEDQDDIQPIAPIHAPPPAAPQVAPLNAAPLNLAQALLPPIDVQGPWLHEASVQPMVMVADALALARHPAFAQHVAHLDGLTALAIEARALQAQNADSKGDLTLDLRVARGATTGGDVAIGERPAMRVYIEGAHPGGRHRPHARFRVDEPVEAVEIPVAESPAAPPEVVSPTESENENQLPFAEAFDEALASDLIPVEPEPIVSAAPASDMELAELELSAAELPAPAAVETATSAHPVWEVDRFQWPKTCEKLLADENGYLATAGDKLFAAVQDGLRVLAITGTRRGEGRSTLALCLARAAAHAGLDVALMDADFLRPQLASKLGIEATFGWQDAALGSIPLSEAAIKSVADGITVLPLESSPATRRLSLADQRVTATIRAAAATFELLILDLGPLGTGEQVAFPRGEACPLDAAIVVRDVRFTSAEECEEIGEMLQGLGIEAVGVAENFVVDEEIPHTSV